MDKVQETAFTDQSTVSDPVSLISILILSSHQRLGFPSGLFSSGILTKILYVFQFLPLVLPSPPIVFISQIAGPESHEMLMLLNVCVCSWPFSVY
jgi:hypothetical protein